MAMINHFDSNAGEHQESFSGVVTNMTLKRTLFKNGSAKVEWIIHFAEDEPLRINLKYPSKDWVRGRYGLQPKPASQAGAFMVSLIQQGIGYELEFDEMRVHTEPSILGKLCAFECKDASFTSQDGKFISFFKWRLMQVETDAEKAARELSEIESASEGTYDEDYLDNSEENDPEPPGNREALEDPKPLILTSMSKPEAPEVPEEPKAPEEPKPKVQKVKQIKVKEPKVKPPEASEVLESPETPENATLPSPACDGDW